jgi:hypothetical protein
MFQVPSIGDLRIRSHVPRGLSVYHLLRDRRHPYRDGSGHVECGVYLGPLGRWLAPRTLISVL